MRQFQDFAKVAWDQIDNFGAMISLRAVIIALLAPLAAASQSLLKDSTVSTFMMKIHYSFQVPFGDMAERFGMNSALGAGIGGKTGRNVFLGAAGSFIFGKNVKETDILDGITDQDGFLLGSSGLYADYSFSEKGFSLQTQGGKIIAFKKPNVNSGLALLLGAGYLQHKISIKADADAVPMLSREYRKGYDRLSSGFMLTQCIGYLYLDVKNKRINCFAGIEVQEGFTKSRRTWNYDENRADESLRKDILVSLKLSWIIPVYRTQTEKYYFY